MSRRARAALAALALVWGASFLLIKVALTAMAPAQVVLVRLSAGALVLLTILALRREHLPRDRVLWAHLVAMGVVANIVPFFLFAWGEQRIDSGLAGVLNGSTPLFTGAFATLALPAERATAARVAGLLLGFLGVVLVVGPWELAQASGAGAETLAGQLACLLAAACYGLSFVYTRRFVSGRDAVLPLAAGQLTAAAAVMVLVSPAVAAQPLRPAVLGILAAVVLGAVGTGLAYLLYYVLIAEAGATGASTVTYLIPVVAVLLGVVVLSEPLRWNLFAGAAVVLAGVGLAEGRFTVPGHTRPSRRPPTDGVAQPGGALR